jgi:ABC-type Fe3+-siderophore transport system permease subunit
MKTHNIAYLSIGAILGASIFFTLHLTHVPAIAAGVPLVFAGIAILLSNHFEKTKSQSPTKSVNAVMIGVLIKLLFSAITIALLIVLDKESKYASAGMVFLTYIIYSVLLIKSALKIENSK